jgi:hypothetical protein
MKTEKFHGGGQGPKLGCRATGEKKWHPNERSMGFHLHLYIYLKVVTLKFVDEVFFWNSILN